MGTLYLCFRYDSTADRVVFTAEEDKPGYDEVLRCLRYASYEDVFDVSVGPENAEQTLALFNSINDDPIRDHVEIAPISGYEGFVLYDKKWNRIYGFREHWQAVYASKWCRDGFSVTTDWVTTCAIDYEELACALYKALES